MKYKNNFFKRFSRIVSLLVLFCYGSTVQLSAQQTTFQYEGQYHDYVIPQTGKQYILLTAVGGDGGRINFRNSFYDIYVGGGRGGFLKAYFKIGNASNNLKPGSTLRFIVGGNGQSKLTAGSTGAGGGGGTGIAYKEVGTQNWTLLMVAGGGGGAAYGLLGGRSYGEPGHAYRQGEEGDGKGGESGADNGGGAGAFGDDRENNVYGSHAKAGWSGGPNAGEPTGGVCTGADIKGGWGFGAGGDGNPVKSAGGGGGGYTGGDGANDRHDYGFGGSSFISASMVPLFALGLEQGTTTSPANGYASLEFVDESPYKSIRFAYNWLDCIHDYSNSTNNGTNIQLHNWMATDAQWWAISPEDRTIRSKLNTAKCLDLSHGNTANGTNIQLWDCNDADAQHWVYNGLYKTIHSGVNSDKCFDAKDGTQNPTNANLQLWDCQYTNNNQKWNISGATTVSNVSNMKHIVPVLATGFAVHSHTGAESGSNIQLWTKDNINTAEQWYFDGLAIKMRDHQNLCIDLSQSNNIQLYNCNGTNAQKWLYDGMTKSIRSVVNPAKCMQIEKNTDGVYGKRSNVDIQDCNGSDAQQFLIQE